MKTAFANSSSGSSPANWKSAHIRRSALHAKLYIMTFHEGDRDKGRVITGSSNFTEAGLQDNLEFNVELKNRSDYEFAIAEVQRALGQVAWT